MDNHVEQIIKGTKTQTRRASGRYKVGKTYSIQPKRTEKGIDQGKIIIIDKTFEVWSPSFTIHPNDAKAEGNYSVEEFEELYNKLHPHWRVRVVYTFRFVPKKEKVGEGAGET